MESGTDIEPDNNPLCVEIVQRMSLDKFRNWLSRAYDTYELSSRTSDRPGFFQIPKKNIWIKSKTYLCNYIQQFEDVNETFVSEHLSELDKPLPISKPPTSSNELLTFTGIPRKPKRVTAIVPTVSFGSRKQKQTTATASPSSIGTTTGFNLPPLSQAPFYSSSQPIDISQGEPDLPPLLPSDVITTSGSPKRATGTKTSTRSKTKAKPNQPEKKKKKVTPKKSSSSESSSESESSGEDVEFITERGSSLPFESSSVPKESWMTEEEEQAKPISFSIEQPMSGTSPQLQASTMGFLSSLLSGSENPSSSSPYVASKKTSRSKEQEEEEVSRYASKRTEGRTRLKPKFRLPVASKSSVGNLKDVGDCVTIATLENFTNGCYVDSVLMIFFTVLEDFTEKYIINKLTWTKQGVCDKNTEKDIAIREKIRNAFETIHDTLALQKGTVSSSIRCENFRQLLQDCHLSGFEPFLLTESRRSGVSEVYSTTTRDASEFMSFIFQLFEVYPMNTIIQTTKTYQQTGETEFVSSISIPDDTPMWTLTIEEAQNNPYWITINTDTLNEETNVVYHENRSVYSTPLVVVSLTRSGFINKELTNIDQLYAPRNRKFDNTSVIPPSEIAIVDGTILIIVAMIIFDNKRVHYTCVFRCADQWYYYDDTKPSEGKRVWLYAENWESLLEKDNGKITKHATSFVYVSKDFLPNDYSA